MPVPSVTITEAARRLGVSTKTIRRRIATGDLEAHKSSGPGGFQYRVTDPSVLVLPAGVPSVDTQPGHRGQREASLDKQVGHVVLELSNRVAAAEVRAARAEWERDQLAAELAALRRPLPAPASEIAPRPWWWPFPVRWGRRY